MNVKGMYLAIYRLGATLFAASQVVVGLQRFAEEPQNGTVSRGQPVTLRCSVLELVGQVQWLRDGFGLGIGPDFDGFPRYRIIQNNDRGEFHLQISDVQLEDDAMFECQVGATTWSRGLKSSRAKITVQVPPDNVSIEGAPRLTVISGQSHELICNARNGRPAPLITWERAGRPVIDGVNYTTHLRQDGKMMDATSRLTILPTKTDHHKELTCRVTSPAMTDHLVATVQLEVQYKPEVVMTVTPEHHRLREFDTVVLTCAAVGSPPEITWRWFSDGGEIQKQNLETFTLRNIGRDHHRRKIACAATNGVGTTREEHTLEMTYGPRFVSDAEILSADPGQSLSISCKVDSNPEAAIVWRQMGSSHSLGNQPILHIPAVSEDHFATFTCTASVEGYEDITKDFRIFRRGPPKIISASEQFSQYGETGILECSVESIPKPHGISWTKDDKPISFSSRSRFQVREEDEATGRRSIVEIADVTDDDFTEYKCSAQNSYGSVQVAIRLSKKEGIPLAFIIAGILASLVVIGVIVFVIVFICLRKRKSKADSDSNSRSSGDSTSAKKTGNVPNIKIEYSTQTTVDGWRESLPEDQFPHYPAEYDELRYPVKDANYPGSPADQFLDYDLNPRSREPYFRPTAFDNVYGTYPRGMANPYAQRTEPIYGPLYGSETYATYGRPPRRDFSPVGFKSPVPQPPASPTDSKLSTNV